MLNRYEEAIGPRDCHHICHREGLEAWNLVAGAGFEPATFGL